MSVDLIAAIAFVTEHGTVLEKARLLRLLMAVEPGRESYQKLLDSQNADGGFPSRPRPGSHSAVDSTLTALWQFDELGMAAHPAASRSLAFLLTMQQPDGGWDENPDLPAHDLPPWIVRSELGTRLYLTTYAAYWLGIFGYAQDASYKAALAYISAHQEGTGQIPGYLHGNWLGIADFLIDGGYTQNAARGMEYLASLPFSEWDDSQIAWAIDCLTRAGLPGSHPWLQAALPELVRRQGTDGSWASEDGPAFAASATVSAIKVLQAHGFVDEIE